MRFELRHVLPKPPHRAYQLLFSNAYRDASTGRSKIQQEVLEEGQKDGKRFCRTRITSQRELPGPIVKILGTSTLSYELVEVFDDDAFCMRWTVIPSKLADKIFADGTYEMHPGPSEAESQRVVRGEVRVEIRFVGSKIEELIGKEIESGYERGTEFARSWLAEQD